MVPARGRRAVQVDVGYDQYMYVGSNVPCERAVTAGDRSRAVPGPAGTSPYEDGDEEPGPPADTEFWAKVAELTTRRGTVLLVETPVRNLSRWHRLTPRPDRGLHSGRERG